MPVDVLEQAVDVLEELPGEPALADAGLAGDRHEPGASLAGGRVEEVLEQAELVVATDERRLEALRAGPRRRAWPRRASARHAGDRGGLALEQLLAGRLEGDGAGCGPVGRLADQDHARRRHRLEAAGGVDEVAGDHALADGAEGDGRLAGQHAGACLEAAAVGADVEPADRFDEVEGRPDRPLGVVLAGRPARPRRP